jgi:hypothetical protein
VTTAVSRSVVGGASVHSIPFLQILISILQISLFTFANIMFYFMQLPRVWQWIARVFVLHTMPIYYVVCMFAPRSRISFQSQFFIYLFVLMHFYLHRHEGREEKEGNNQEEDGRPGGVNCKIVHSSMSHLIRDYYFTFV